MQSFVIRVYRERSEDNGAIAGMIEDIGTGEEESFHSFDDLQALLAHAIGQGQVELPDLQPQEHEGDEKIAVIG